MAGRAGAPSHPAQNDRHPTDGHWVDIVGECVHRIGLAPQGDDEAVRWVVGWPADNHVHVVATLARQDGQRVDTRQLLHTLDRLSHLSSTPAGFREPQGRTDQAFAARRAAQLLVAEQTRRTHAAYVSAQALTATPSTSRTAGHPAAGPAPEPVFSGPRRPAGPVPARRPGRAR